MIGALIIGCCLVAAAPVLGADDSLPRDHAKYRTTLEVFDRLVQAIGDGRTAPTLQVVPVSASSPMQVAWFNGERHAVAIDERAYDLFAAMGADSLNGLAWLLGHELAHYYQDHSWTGDFGNGFADLDVGRRMKALSSQRAKAIEIETQADYFGAFFGQVAGYQTLRVIPAALEGVYAEYELDPELTGYPTLVERQAIARRAGTELRQLLPVFDVGNRLLLLGLYEEAGRCFDLIAQTFPSREILNNAGVARALEALALFPEMEPAFAYPLELDGATRLRQLGGKAADTAFEHENAERRDRLLQEAQASFERARQRDDTYVPAYVNLACVLDLQGEHEDGEFWAKKAARLARTQGDETGRGRALIAQGISAAHLDPTDQDGPRKLFEQARAGAPTLAALNLAVLKQETAAAPPAHRVAQPETIAGLGVADYRVLTDDPDVKTRVPPGGWGQPAMTIYSKATTDWDGLLVDTGYRTVMLLSTSVAYDGQSGLGIRRGTELSQVESRYGAATRSVTGARARYFVYESSRIVFGANAQGQVQGWMVYAIK